MSTLPKRYLHAIFIGSDSTDIKFTDKNLCFSTCGFQKRNLKKCFLSFVLLYVQI